MNIERFQGISIATIIWHSQMYRTCVQSGAIWVISAAAQTRYFIQNIMTLVRCTIGGTGM